MTVDSSRHARPWAPAAFAATSLAGLGLVVAVAAAFALLLALVESRWGPLAAADEAIVDAANAAVSSSTMLVTTAEVITVLGAPVGVAIVVVVPVLWLLIRRLPRPAAYVAVTGIGAAVLGPGVKELVERARPMVEVPLSSPSGASFPSGHTVAVTIGWGALLLVFLPVVPSRWRRLAIAAVVSVVVLVGLSRVALGVHYPSDVIGGWLVGVLWLGATAAAFRRSRHLEHLRWSAGVDRVEPPERRDLQPAPAHDRPLPEGGSTMAKLAVAAVVLAGALIGIGLLITEQLAWLRRLDREFIAGFAGVRSEALTSLSSTVGWLGGVTGIVTVLAIAIPLTLAVTRRWRPSLFLFVAAAGQGLVYLAASRLVGRDRPDVTGSTEGMIATVSFPSGHVAAAVAAYGGMALLVLAWSRSRARYGAIAVAVAIVLGVAFSRLYKGVHYPSDVVAGILYGLAWLGLCWRWLRPWPGRGDLRRDERP